MSRVLLLTITTLVATTYQTDLDPVIDQLPIFKNNTSGSIGILTTSSGAPVPSNYTGSTLNTNLITNPFFMDKIHHFVQENIPERMVHMKGAGAFGYFETTHNVSNICSADLFSEIGKKTPVVARFSVGVTGKGGPDTTATPMGFGIKFYTKEGNWDLLCLNSRMFFLKDPTEFPNIIHALKRNPRTNVQDVNMVWDFVAQHPESLYMFLVVYGGRGIPYSYRHMPGYPIHTFQVYNATGTSSFVRFHFIPDAGIKYLNSTVAASTACSNLDYYTEDLYRSIANGNSASWTLYWQVMTEADVKNMTFDVFDTSKTIPENLFPLQAVGKLVLNRNPKNYFADIEQLALNPTHLVRGMLGSPDKVYEARRIVYDIAQAHRLGVNYNNIPVNCPYRSSVYTYNRDGVPPLGHNGDDAPNYYPNVFNGPEPYVDKYLPSLIKIEQDEPDNFEQAREYYTNQMSDEERELFVDTITSTLCYATQTIQDKVVEGCGKIHANLSKLVTAALKEKTS